MESRQIIINGSALSYATAGKGERSLVFLHGWRSSKEAWLPVAQHIENSGYRLIFVDLPGFGASETPKKPYTLHDYAETVREFSEKLGMKAYAIIGHSAGARMAVKLAVNHPSLFSKLVIIASGGKRPPFLKIKTFFARLAKPFFMPRFMAPLRAAIYAWIGADDYLATPELQKTFVNVINENLDPLLKSVRNETLIVWGSKDTTAPPAYGAHMAHLVPHARFEIIKGAGHYCFSEQPERFSTLLSDFLK